VLALIFAIDDEGLEGGVSRDELRSSERDRDGEFHGESWPALYEDVVVVKRGPAPLRMYAN
jgi:hypothetical protein